jgi:hypothetical protein
MQLPVRFKYSNGGMHEDSGQTVNISFGGFHFETQAKLAVGDQIELVLPLPAPLCAEGNGWARCRGRVIWVERRSDGMMGIGAEIETYQVMPSQA